MKWVALLVGTGDSEGVPWGTRKEYGLCDPTSKVGE